MELDNAHAETIVGRLDQVIGQLAKQNSFARMFVVGLCYGIGFAVGSAIIATLVIGVLAPFVAEIPGVREAFGAGVEVLRGNQ